MLMSARVGVRAILPASCPIKVSNLSPLLSPKLHLPTEQIKFLNNNPVKTGLLKWENKGLTTDISTSSLYYGRKKTRIKGNEKCKASTENVDSKSVLEHNDFLRKNNHDLKAKALNTNVTTFKSKKRLEKRRAEKFTKAPSVCDCSELPKNTNKEVNKNKKHIEFGKKDNVFEKSHVKKQAGEKSSKAASALCDCIKIPTVTKKEVDKNKKQTEFEKKDSVLEKSHVKKQAVEKSSKAASALCDCIKIPKIKNKEVDKTKEQKKGGDFEKSSLKKEAAEKCSKASSTLRNRTIVLKIKKKKMDKTKKQIENQNKGDILHKSQAKLSISPLVCGYNITTSKGKTKKISKIGNIKLKKSNKQKTTLDKKLERNKNDKISDNKVISKESILEDNGKNINHRNGDISLSKESKKHNKSEMSKVSKASKKFNKKKVKAKAKTIGHLSKKSDCKISTSSLSRENKKDWNKSQTKMTPKTNVSDKKSSKSNDVKLTYGNKKASFLSSNKKKIKKKRTATGVSLPKEKGKFKTIVCKSSETVKEVDNKKGHTEEQCIKDLAENTEKEQTAETHHKITTKGSKKNDHTLNTKKEENGPLQEIQIVYNNMLSNKNLPLCGNQNVGCSGEKAADLQEKTIFGKVCCYVKSMYEKVSEVKEGSKLKSIEDSDNVSVDCVKDVSKMQTRVYRVEKLSRSPKNWEESIQKKSINKESETGDNIDSMCIEIEAGKGDTKSVHKEKR